MTQSIVEPSARPLRRLNQPWRGLVALVEFVVAAAAVIVGVACWHRSIVTIVTPFDGGHAPLVSTVLFGNWGAGAIGLVTIAALLVLDALREIMLAMGTHRRPVTPLPR